MKENKSKNNIFACFVKGLDLPHTAVGCNSSIELIGNNRVVTENVKRIIEYQNDNIRLETDKFTVVISGTKLTFNNYSNNIVVIDGTVKSVCLE